MKPLHKPIAGLRTGADGWGGSAPTGSFPGL